MAKGKKGPALFEVIRAAQQKQQDQQRKLEHQRSQEPGVLSSAASKLKSLSWMHGNRTPVMREIPPEMPVAGDEIEYTQVRAAKVPVVEERVAPAPVAKVPAQVAPPRPVITTIPKDAEPVAAPSDEIARRVREEIAAASRIKDTFDDISPDPVLNSVADLFGPQRRDELDQPRKPFAMPIQLNYTTGLAAGIALLVIVGVVLVVFKINGQASDVSTLASGKPRPDVLNIKPPAAPTGNPTNLIVEKPAPTDPAVARVPTSNPPGSVSVESSLAPVKLPANGKRIIGVQYIVLLSVPRKEPADELVKFLTEQGVSVTAEQGLPGYSKTWFSVVTTAGFHRTRTNPQYDGFIEPINKLMKQYANGSKFKSFKPDIYTWRAAG